MRSNFQARGSALANESGFTLVELLVVLVIIGVLLGIAVSVYPGFETRAQQTAAMADVRQAVFDAEAYYSDHSTYAGTPAMSASELKTDDDSGLLVSTSGSPGVVTAKAESAVTYCVSAVVHGHWAHVIGPGGQVINDDNDAGGAATSDPCP
jgi:type IV pilus assembly protein PilA